MAEFHQYQKPLWRITARERRFILILGDLIVVSISLIISLYFWSMGDQWLKFSWQFLKERPPNWYYLLPVLWIGLMFELYDVRRAGHKDDTIRGILTVAGFSTVLYLVIFFISEPKSLPRRGVAAFIGAATVLTLLWRLLYIRIFTTPAFLRRVIVIGAGRAGTSIVDIIQEINPSPFTLIGYVDDDLEKQGRSFSGLEVIGDSTKLLEIIEKEHVTDLIFAISGEMKPSLYAAILKAEERGIEVTTMPTIYEELLGRVPISLLDDDWILRSFVDRSHASGSYELGKRMMDLLGAFIGLIILCAFFPFISLGIIIDDGFPIIFKQKRVGKSGKIFHLLKFRSMRRDAEKDGVARFAVENDERATRWGRFLRKTHLDELPQFLNILKGDLSLVGPRAERPELVEQFQKEVPFYRARLFIKPGLTGWAQVNYHYASNPEETAVKLEYDLYYIMHRNILLDILILVRTVGQVIGFRGI